MSRPLQCATIPDMRDADEIVLDGVTYTGAKLRAIVASLAANAGSEPVAWQYRSLPDVGGVWFECSKERAEQRAAHPERWEVRPLYTHPSPPEGMVGGWTKASQQLPPCGDGQLFIGVNSAGFACVFNEITSNIVGAVHCLYETAEECIDVMSGLDLWQPFTPPTSSADSGKGE